MVHRLVLAFQISFYSLFGISDGIRELYFCQVVSVEALNITVVGGGDGLLRLNHFEVVGNAGAETIARLGEGLFRQTEHRRRLVMQLHSRTA